MRFSSWFRHLSKTALIFLLKALIRTLEILPALGILRPLFSSSIAPVRKQKKLIDPSLCPFEVDEFQSHQLSNVRIIEVTAFRESEATRGIGNYLKRLFSEIGDAALEGVVFLSFARHEKSKIYPKFLLGRNIYYVDSRCIHCFHFIEQLSKVSHKITFTSYFHENISPKYCLALLDLIPKSNVIIYDLIPKLNLLNFSSVSKMMEYFAKYRLLTGTNLYPISRSTKTEIEVQGLQVENVIRYNLVQAEVSKEEKGNAILLFGSMSPRKNILRTVMAWDLIQQEFPEFRLTLVGHYSNFAKLLILKILKSGTGSISFTGEISDLELDKLFQNSKLLVAPSTVEGLGLPLLRAIEFGTPFICARIDSYLEFVANKKSFFDPFSVHEISQTIRSAITSPHEYVTGIDSIEIGTVDLSEII